MSRRHATTPASPIRVATAAHGPESPASEHPELIGDDWIAYRPRRHPVGLALVAGLVCVWAGFLLWMVVLG